MDVSLFLFLSLFIVLILDLFTQWNWECSKKSQSKQNHIACWLNFNGTITDRHIERDRFEYHKSFFCCFHLSSLFYLFLWTQFGDNLPGFRSKIVVHWKRFSVYLSLSLKTKSRIWDFTRLTYEAAQQLVYAYDLVPFLSYQMVLSFPVLPKIH